MSSPMDPGLFEGTGLGSHPDDALLPLKRKKTVEFIDLEEQSTEKDSKNWRNQLNSLYGRHLSLSEQRTNLLGKPINVKTHRKDAKYRRMQSKIYNFLERPRGCLAASYHILVFIMVLCGLTLSVFSTIPDYQDDAVTALYYLELALVFWFSTEYAFRIWSSGCRSRYQGCSGRLRFATRPFCIIDVIVITATLVVVCLRTAGQVFAASAIRSLRFFQILRMVRIDRRGGTWKLLGSVVWAHRQELITTLYIGFLGLIFASFLIYLCEKNVNEKFATFADALWWGVITLCTVGYGDKVPQTWAGRIVASFCALLGISFFALPAGILGSGFALKVQQQQRQKHLVRRRGPAAYLIQSLWRLYASDEQSRSVATWKVHLSITETPACKPVSNHSFASRFSRKSFRRSQSSRRQEGQQNPKRPVGPTLSADGTTLSTGARRSCSGSGDFGSEKTGNAAQILNIWHLTSPGSLSRRGRISTESLISNQSVFSPPAQKAATAQLGQANDDEAESILGSLGQLTEKHKNAIRFLRRLKYLVARRKFKEALKPYDVKDVIEQYSAGHVDLSARVKTIQGRLDTILGKAGSNARDVYDSKICLAHRIVKVERQVEDIEAKMDYLIELVIDSRKRQNGRSDFDNSVFGPSECNSASLSPIALLAPKSFVRGSNLSLRENTPSETSDVIGGSTLSFSKTHSVGADTETDPELSAASAESPAKRSSIPRRDRLLAKDFDPNSPDAPLHRSLGAVAPDTLKVPIGKPRGVTAPIHTTPSSKVRTTVIPPTPPNELRSGSSASSSGELIAPAANNNNKYINHNHTGPINASSCGDQHLPEVGSFAGKNGNQSPEFVPRDFENGNYPAIDEAPEDTTC